MAEMIAEELYTIHVLVSPVLFCFFVFYVVITLVSF